MILVCNQFEFLIDSNMFPDIFQCIGETMVCISFAFCLGLSFIFAVKAETNCTAEQKAFDTLEFSVCWKNLYYYGHEACREV